VVEAAREPRFVQEHLEGVRVVRQVDPDHLEHHKLAEATRTVGHSKEHPRHAAMTQLR
jgi:hypothetical protein